MKPLLLASLLLVLVTLVAPSAERVGLMSDGPIPGAKAAAIISEITGLGINLDEELLDTNPPVILALNDVSHIGALGALCHAMNCWYVPLKNGDYLLTRSVSVPPSGGLKALTRDTTMSDRMDLELRMRDLMKPWLGDGAGLSQIDGRWTAVLDAEGQAQFLALLALIERGQPQVPAQIPIPGTAAKVLSPGAPAINTDIPLATLADALHRGWNLSVSVAPDLHQRMVRSDGPLRSVGDLKAALAPLKMTWKHHVLHIGREPALEAEHPASRRRLAWIPLPEFPRDGDGDLMAARIQAQVVPELWRFPGWGMLWQNDRSALLVAADTHTIGLVLDALDTLQMTWR